MRSLLWAAPLLLQGAVLAGLLAGGAWSWTGAVLMLGLIPILDHAIGEGPWPPPRAETAAERLWPRLVAPLQAAILLVALDACADEGAWWGERLGAVASAGVACGGIGIVAAHELFHRRGRLDRALGEWLMANVQYSPYVVEHVHSHHLRVATPEDAVTAPRGRGAWAHLPRAIARTHRHAWEIERERAGRRGAARASDRRLRWLAWPAATLGAAWAWGGPWWPAGLLAIAAIAVTLLELVNYVEHYGLRRAPLPGGGWEPQDARHSWDSEHRLTRILLFALPRHAAHHLRATKPYPELEYREESPKMPTGYAGMVLMAALPPLWRRVMDPRIPGASAPGP